jgi:hypothetical protein
MLRLPTIATPLAVVAALAGVQAAPAQSGQPRQPAATRSGEKTSVPSSRDKTVLPRVPTQAEKNWMDRASAASNGGGGGGGGGGGM